MGPLFILGFPRSGTTAMAQGINSLERFGPYETEGHFIFLFAEPINRIAEGQLNPNSILLKDGVALTFLADLAGVINALYSATGEASDTNWIDKTPGLGQIQAVPAIATLFPDARYIYMYRPPVDAVRSSVTVPAWQLAGKETTMADRWVACQGAWRKVRAGLPAGAYAEIYQPDMLTAPDVVATALAPFLQLSLKEATALATFWATNRDIARSGRPATSEAFALSEALANEIAERAASEVPYWARLAAGRER